MIVNQIIFLKKTIYNKMDAVPDIKPIKTKQYDVPESRYKQAGKLPFRSIILGSSGSGKTILLQKYDNRYL